MGMIGRANFFLHDLNIREQDVKVNDHVIYNFNFPINGWIRKSKFSKSQTMVIVRIWTKYALLNPSNYVLELTKPFNPLHPQTLIP